MQVSTGMIFITGSSLGWYGMKTTSALFSVFLSSIGMTYPNAAAIAFAPFSRNVGSAPALLGFIQMGTGALISTGIGSFGARSVIGLLSGNALLALGVFAIGRRLVPNSMESSDGGNGHPGALMPVETTREWPLRDFDPYGFANPNRANTA